MALRARLTPDKRPFGVELDGDLKIVDLKPLYQGKFTLTENRQNAEAQTADGDDARNALRVTGGFELTNERIRVPEYRLEVGPKDDPYLVTGEATLDTGQKPEFLLLADGQQIDVSRIGNTGEAGKTGRDPAISVRQRLAAMLAIAADIPIPQVAGRASLKLPAIVIGDTTVRDVRLDLRPDGAGWMIDNAVALLPGRTQLEAKGRLNLRGQRAFRGELLVASNQPSGLATWLAGSVDPSIRTLKTAGFSASVNLTETLQQFERLEVAAGPAILRGRIERQALDGVPPSLSLQLKGNRIDLEAMQGAGRARGRRCVQRNAAVACHCCRSLGGCVFGFRRDCAKRSAGGDAEERAVAGRARLDRRSGRRAGRPVRPDERSTDGTGPVCQDEACITGPYPRSSR